MANATPSQDDALYQAQIDAGIPIGVNDVDVAKAVCKDIANGWDPAYEAASLADIWSGDTTYTQAKQFVFIALNIYCPNALGA